jgi:2,3-bisphosphoglycerate-independent phosphoglycerate mutase
MPVKVVSPTVLIVLDGFGIRATRTANAIALARTPHLDRLRGDFPTSELQASGIDVGLPPGQMGNSEVGHLNMGAGRVVYQDITRISRAIEDGSFAANTELKTVLHLGRERALHLVGLLSDGGVHSSLDHLRGLIKTAAESSVRQLYIHAFTDGRDTPPKSALAFVRQVEQMCTQYGAGEIATVTGRFYGMDRDKRWDRVQRAYQVLTVGSGNGVLSAPSAELAVSMAYERGESDEFIQPTAIGDAGSPRAVIQEGDGVMFFNFRADRARELSRALTADIFTEFARPAKWPKPGRFLCMTQYDESLPLPVMFPPQHPRETLGEVLSRAGVKQLRAAETEKYAHVTYFFNGGEERAFPGEERLLVPSPREVATYDLKPVMSLPELTRQVVEKIRTDDYGFVLVNFANPDMVGHTGHLNAAIEAIEEVDRAIGEIVAAAQEKKGRVIITADHGNCETMVDPDTGEPHTAHTTNPVPLIVADAAHRHAHLRNGALCDVAPTILKLMQIAPPPEMTGKSLLED